MTESELYNTYPKPTEVIALFILKYVQGESTGRIGNYHVEYL